MHGTEGGDRFPSAESCATIATSGLGLLMIATQVREYIVERQLGDGGMGEVYLARHSVLGGLRAIKVLLPALTKNREMVQRFINEARATDAIKNQNIIRVFDCGQLSDGQWFIVMEYLEGATLGRFIETARAPIAPQLVLQVVAGIANGLQAAHEQGILHRDLKSDNVFLVTRGQNRYHPIVLDFGMAKLADALGPGLHTRKGLVFGTPSYMPPEQLRGESIGTAGDVFALACIAYEMASGGWYPYQLVTENRDAFIRLPLADLAVRHAKMFPIDLATRVPGMNPSVVRALMRGLEPDPERRLQTPRDFLSALAEATEDGIKIALEHAPNISLDAVRPTVQAAVPAAAVALAIGSQSKYELLAKIGEGGMAEVYLARARGEEAFERQVAIKRIHSNFAQGKQFSQFAAMFIAEARMAAALRHENIVSVIAFERDAANTLFLVMEYVEGRDLAALIATGRIPVPIAIHIITQILHALSYAHAPRPSLPAGLVHRDISPGNILISFDGGVKVTDFGIAKAADVNERGVSIRPRGKVHYMSPEQIACAPLDGRADLFAAGIVLWEMLAGRSLFQGEAHEVQSQVAHRDIPSPNEYARDVAPDLEAVVMRLLEQDRDRRFATAALAIEALAGCRQAPTNGRSELEKLLAVRFAERRGAASSPAIHSVLTAPDSPHAAPGIRPSTFASAASEVRPAVVPRPGDRRWIVAALLAACGAGGVVFAMSRRGEPQSATDLARAPASDDAAQPPPAPTSQPHSAAVALPDARSVDAAPEPPVDAARDAKVAPSSSPSTPTPSSRPVARDADTPLAHSNVPIAAASARPPAAHLRGTLIVHVDPWADVSIDGGSAHTTPLQTTLPIGIHRVRLVNPVRQKDETLTITIDATKPSVIEKNW
ncbi:MAG TPA: protein kinase [Kofleriaceae bacterium]